MREDRVGISLHELQELVVTVKQLERLALGGRSDRPWPPGLRERAHRAASALEAWARRADERAGPLGDGRAALDGGAPPPAAEAPGGPLAAGSPAVEPPPLT